MHARKTRKRKKVQMESIQTTIETLQEEVSAHCALIQTRGQWEGAAVDRLERRCACLHTPLTRPPTPPTHDRRADGCGWQ